MRTAKHYFTPEELKAARKEQKARQKLKAEGWIGINKRGALVDRRECPSATPCRQNKLLGFGIPKTEEELKNELN